mmetsp:Transcript_2986/g.7636  ORF Transcript_2986/g.7636 Transcript_2986/m.7636 type:complete len:869 (-) Transcript_2986:78-2684(-)
MASAAALSPQQGGSLPAASSTLGAAASMGSTGGGTLAQMQGAKTGPKTDGFRAHNVRFLQQQNQEVIRELERIELERDEALLNVQKWEEKRSEYQQEYAQLQRNLAEHEDKVQLSTAEIHKRDEQIRVLSEQNRSLLDMLEQEETTSKERDESVKDLQTKQDKLQQISDQYDRMRDTGNQQLTSAYTEIAKMQEDLRNAQNESEQLKEAERHFALQAKADIEELEQKLAEAKQQNVQRLQQMQHNEVNEHRLSEALHRLKETLDEVTVQRKGMKTQLELDAGSRDGWVKSKAEVERRQEVLEQTVQALRGSLRAAEEANRLMQDENRSGGENFRKLGDKVYALMDQLRANQLDLKKAESGGLEKQNRISRLEKQQAELQEQLQTEVDAKLAAEADARNASQMQALLQKKNKMLDEALALALKAQEKVEKRLLELREKANALQVQNEYLGTRIDGNEEDKGAFKYELRRLEEELRQASSVTSQLESQRTQLEDRLNDMEAERAALKAELDYIKREDMLDETGRTKPVLIESESPLIERLQMNEFLYSAQQARNPVPMLVEKVSHILELLHTAQTQSDVYLQDLQRSNSMLTALRQKNMHLYERVQLCETWKMRALLKIASNEFEMRQSVKGHNNTHLAKVGHALYLDGLQYSNKELQELHRVIVSYNKQDTVREIRLRDNQLDQSSVPHIHELLELCPYMSLIDLSRNRLDETACSAIQAYVERIPGVTHVQRDPATGDLTAKSGNQTRLQVHIHDQTPPDPQDVLAQVDLGADPAGMQADDFLSGAAGVVSTAKLQGPDASAGAGSRTVLPQQRGASQDPRKGNLNTSRSDKSLPRIAGGADSPKDVPPRGAPLVRPSSGRSTQLRRR